MSIRDYTDASLFGISLTTYRDKDIGPDAVSYFPYECEIAALSVLFFRTTVYQRHERVFLRWLFAILLAALAYFKKNYELIMAVEIFSYAVAYLLNRYRTRSAVGISTTLLWIAACAGLSLSFCHWTAIGDLGHALALVTPKWIISVLSHLFPVAEMNDAYSIMEAFANPQVLQKQIYHLLFVTFHIQVGMGYLGIDFLTKEQHRRNLLIRMDVQSQSEAEDAAHGKVHNADKNVKIERARRFQKGAAPFILFAALPYMFQIIAYGNVNKFAFCCLKQDLHRTIRVNQVFDHDSHLTALATESATSPESYASSMSNVASTVYEFLNRKLFSLPKVLLLPGVMMRQPMLVVSVFPFIFLSDWIKANCVSFMTRKVEELQKELQTLRAVRSKIEAFDIKNAELLQRSGKGSTQFTQKRWQELTVKIQSRVVLSDLISRSKGFFSFIQRNFVFNVLIDCALANLIAVGKIVSSEIFVFSRAIEDAVDMVLMRSRGEAELARMMTEIDKLNDLKKIWEKSKSKMQLRCILSPPGQHNIVLRNLHYSRGTASVRADHVELPPGIYALTGSNGSGKSTLFRVLMSCDTNERPIDLPDSINLLTPMEPLMEEDDFIREVCCEAAQDDDDDVDDSNTTLNHDQFHRKSMSIDVSGEIETIADNLKQSLPRNVVPKLSITMPSSHVVEISQNFYWPLYTRPLDWIYQEHILDTYSGKEAQSRARKVAELLYKLEFVQPAKLSEGEEATLTNPERFSATVRERTVQGIISTLQDEKQDWFGDLSGGQKSKVELVRKVFLHNQCPDVLLIDETMAPLDPSSKALVMGNLKEFCKGSIIIVIYHTDVGQGREIDGQQYECVPSNGFFHKNIHLENGAIHVRDTC